MFPDKTIEITYSVENKEPLDLIMPQNSFNLKVGQPNLHMTPIERDSSSNKWLVFKILGEDYS